MVLVLITMVIWSDLITKLNHDHRMGNTKYHGFLVFFWYSNVGCHQNMESPIQGIQQGMLFGQANLLLGSWYTLVPLSAVQYRVAMQIIQPSSLYVLNIHSQVDLLPSRTITMILSQEFFVRVAKISCVMKRLNLINQTCKVHTENGRQPKHIWHVINEVLSHLYI